MTKSAGNCGFGHSDCIVSSSCDCIVSRAAGFNWIDFSSCDTTSSILGKGKISFCDTWKIVPEITSIFAQLSKVTVPAEITQEDYKLIEKFFIVLYSTTTNTEEMNSAQRMLFTHGGRSIENIPPTPKGLKQHILRAALQASMWNDCLKKQRSYLNPTEWAWRKFDERYIPF